MCFTGNWNLFWAALHSIITPLKCEAQTVFFFVRSIQFVYHFTDSSACECLKDKTKTCLFFLWIPSISSQFIFVFSSENNSFIIVSLVWRRCHWMRSIRCCVFFPPFLRTIWFVSVIMTSKCLLWLMESVLDWKRAHSPVHVSILPSLAVDKLHITRQHIYCGKRRRRRRQRRRGWWKKKYLNDAFNRRVWVVYDI